MSTPNIDRLVQPYLFFNGRCEEAIEFYRKALGAQVEVVMRFKDAPPSDGQGCGGGPLDPNKVMHTSFRVGETTIMASDGQCTGTTSFQGFALSINLLKAADAERLFSALAQGGQVVMPFGKTFFSPGFGMVTDRFGVPWMLHTAPAEQR